LVALTIKAVVMAWVHHPATNWVSKLGK